jgi:arsenical pump membrane protein
MAPSTANLAIWAISAVATAAVIARPFRLPEAIWAAGGAVLLIATGLLSLAAGLTAIGKGLDVYLFLIGMMLLSEVARREGLFDWVAAYAVNHAKGSPRRLFLLIYIVGVVVTVFLSNDATAVVLTPAVFAAARKAKVDPLPYLFICAFVANAASFVLPISNPANIVLYGDHTPPLGRWLASFALPSLLAILATYLVLRQVEARRPGEVCERDIDQPPLSVGGKLALAGIAVTALALVIVSALDKPLGAPTALLGVATTATILTARKAAPWPILKSVSWSVLPLVAGLFVLVEALGQTGLISALAGTLESAGNSSAPLTAAVGGGLLAIASNLMNNLPAGLIASTAISQAHPPRMVIDALLIGVDLGPNLSITGSLATILWLAAIRREGEDVTFWRFLKVGALVTPPALALAIGARVILGLAG